MALVGYDVIEELRGVAKAFPEADNARADQDAEPADDRPLLPQPTAEFLAQFAEPV